MAIIYGKNTAVDYAAGNLASFGKSYSRMGAAPLDMYEVWYDYAELVKYASFRGNDANGNPVYDGNTEVTDTSAVTSYVGQKVAYVNETEGKIYHYSIELNGSLKEIGTSPVGDEKSIVVGTNGTVSLKGIEALVFERDIIGEDGQPTGQKENVQFQPLMTKDGLIWVEPSKTTVEGLASLIDGLTARVSALENDRVTEQELADAVKAEADRATAAEEALGKRIDEIDFIDADELATAISGVEAKIPTNNNQLDNGAGYQTADDVSNAIANKADKADTLAGYGITDAYTKTEVDTELAKKAEKTALEALQARVEAFLDNTGATTEAIDTLQELITYINEHDDVELADIIADVEALQAKVDTGDQKVSEYVTAAIDALKIGDYAKAADLTTLAGRVDALEAKPFDTYATKTEVEAVDAKFQDVVAKTDFEKFKTENAQAIADARTGAVSDVEAKGYAVASDVASTYATKQFIGEIPTDADATTIVGYINEKAQEVLDSATGGSSESAASVKQQLDTYKAANDPKVNVLLAEVYGALAEGETEYNYAADSRIDALEKADAAQDALIASNTTLAQKGVDDAAAAALAVTNLTNGQVAQNKNDIAAVKDIVNGETNENSHAKRIAKLEAHDLAHGEEYTALNTKVGENTTAIAKKADAANVYTKSEADALINAKANTADVYTKDEVDTKVQAAIDAIPEVDFKPYAKVTDVEAIYKAGEGETPASGILAVEIERAKAAEKANADAIAALIGDDADKTIRAIAAEETAAIVAGADAKYDTLKEIADFIMSDETGAAKMATDIAALQIAVGNAESGLVKAVADNTAAIAAIVQPKASTEISVGTDGTLGINEMNVNKLVQTDGDTLVLNGGAAK
jgi:hypothetical protein